MLPYGVMLNSPQFKVTLRQQQLRSHQPIALLNTVYKFVASYINSTYNFLIEKYHIISPSRHGSRRNTRTADHMFSVLSSNAYLQPHNQHLYVLHRFQQGRKKKGLRAKGGGGSLKTLSETPPLQGSCDRDHT